MASLATKQLLCAALGSKVATVAPREETVSMADGRGVPHRDCGCWLTNAQRGRHSSNMVAERTRRDRRSN
jgi:hypothetical protein